MTRTFDGSSGTLGESAPESYYEEPSAPEPQRGGDSLDMLLDAVAQREAEAEELYPVEIPGLGVRLMCALDFEYTDWQDWQVKSVPREKRKKPGPMDINQLQLCTHVLVGTCQHLEHRRGDGEWAPITGHDGTPVAFGSDEMLRKFGQMDTASLLRKLFGGSDGHVLRAGMRVISAAGYGDEADEKEALEGGDPLG